MRNLSPVIHDVHRCDLRPGERVVAAALNDELSQLFIATCSNDILTLSTSFADGGNQVRKAGSRHYSNDRSDSFIVIACAPHIYQTPTPVPPAIQPQCSERILLLENL
jgi:hypothetical protein